MSVGTKTVAEIDQDEAPARPAPIPATSLAGGPLHELRAVWVVVKRECIRFASDPLRVIVGVLQPILFLFVLGSGLGSLVNGHGEFGASLNLRTFLYPGAAAMSVLFTAPLRPCLLYTSCV